MKPILLTLLLSTSLLRAETLDELLATADQHNPAITAARLQRDAARQRSTLAGALPDPRLTYGLYLQEIETKTGPQKQRAGLSQTFPLFGKRALTELAATHSADALNARVRAARATVFFDLKKIWFNAFYLHRAIETAQTRKTLFQTLEQTVERTIKDGGDARDLLDLRITLTRIDDSLRTLESQEPALRANLNALLDRQEPTPLTFPESLPEPPPFNAANLHAAFRQKNPAIEEQHAQLARRKAQEKLARRTALPAITLGADWIQTDGGDDPLIASIALHLPVWVSKNRAERLNAEFEAAAQESLLHNQINTLHARLTTLLASYNDDIRRKTFYENQLIPDAEQHFELTRTAYELGEADLRELTASEERLLDLRLARERSRADCAITHAEIEMLLGGPSNDCE